MRLSAIGWRRSVHPQRKLAEFPLADVASGDPTRSDPSLQYVIEDGEDLLRYEFVMNVSGMSGDYHTYLRVTRDDVLAMFEKMCGEMTVAELATALEAMRRRREQSSAP